MNARLTLGEKLKDLRTTKRLKLADVEAATGISTSTLQRFDSHKADKLPPGQGKRANRPASRSCGARGGEAGGPDPASGFGRPPRYSDLIRSLPSKSSQPVRNFSRKRSAENVWTPIS